MNRSPTQLRRASALFVGALLLASACGSDDDTSSSESTSAPAPAETSQAPDSTSTPAATDNPTESSAPSADASSFKAEVWADNWFALYANGELVGEDSVPITTERSFNSETFTFEATYPLTIAIEAKDFKETDSGIEYIGQQKQQMGDGGLIAQITDTTTGEVIAVTDGEWATLVIHRAPLNTDCEKDADPDATCQYEITTPPADWAEPGFDDSGWSTATVWSEADVSPKDGFDEIAWDPAADLIWGTDLEVDNTVLVRVTISG